MDFFSHGLWAFLISEALKKRTGRKINSIFFVFWGLFPDLFAFVIPFLWLFWGFILGRIPFGNLPRPDKIEPVSPDVLPAAELASSFYSVGHSLVVFSLVCIIIGAIILLNRRFNFFSGFRQFPLVLGGWFLHILMDIPTHSYGLYSTPVFWPLSDWKYNGLYWGTPWFLVLDYISIAITYYYYFGLDKIKVFVNWAYWKSIISKIKLDLD